MLLVLLSAFWSTLLTSQGPYPTESEVDPDLVNAGCETTTPAAGAASFDSPSSFGMIRGQHVAM